jgi:hypothetical protein
MKVIEVKNDDFVLQIECNNLNSVFEKAEKKQSQILTSTTYRVSEGEISIFDFETKQLELLISDKTYPLIFENKEYFIGISFNEKKSIKSPFIYSRLREIEDKFFYREELGFLAGTINFGNDLGKSDLVLRYSKGDKLKEISFSFEVFPIKLDFRRDYDKIIHDIEEEYRNLVLDFLKKTYTSFQTGDSPNTDLIWWQVFGELYLNFIDSAKFILNKPHSRIVRQTKYLKADNIIKWSNALEEEYSNFRQIPNKKYHSEYKTLSTDTAENQFFKYAVFESLKKYKRIKKFIESKFKGAITKSFVEKLLSIETQLETISANPFFRTVNNFKGIRQESLVLQKATGYNAIYKSWIMLNSGLQLLDGIQKIELKNIAELYQIWCFLEIKSIIQKLLGKEKPDSIELAEIQIDDFIFKIKRGVKSKVSFVQDNGDIIELFHDFSYNTKQGDVIDSLSDDIIKPFTVNQRPDIVLQITKKDLKEKYGLTYLFDAKYRLDIKSQYGETIDLPPDDAINQMHRYRDAIYFVNKERKKPEKEVIGAYVLFPGSGDRNKIENTAYFKSIIDVNIGAFPLLPNDETNNSKSLLEEHLKRIIGSDTESILNEISPQKDNTYESPNPEVLIGIVKKDAQTAYFETETKPLYYTGKVKPSKLKENDYVKIKSTIKYFAPYYSGKGIREYYKIEDFSIIPRNEVFPVNHSLHKKNDVSDRLVIQLGEKFIIRKNEYFTCPITIYRYAKLREIRNPKDNKIEVLKVS